MLRFKKKAYKAKPDEYTVHIGNIKELEKVGNIFNVICKNAFIKIIVLKDDLLRIRISLDGKFKELSLLPKINDVSEKVEITFKEEQEYFRFNTKCLSVLLMKSPFRILFYNVENQLILMDDFSYGICWDDKQIGIYKKLHKEECIFGLGEHSGNLDRTGQDFVNYNFPRYKEPFYSSIPFFIGIYNKLAYGIFVNKTSRTFFNFGKTLKDKTFFGTDGNEIEYYFIYGPKVKQVLRLYTDLTGRGDLPPA